MIVANVRDQYSALVGARERRLQLANPLHFLP